MQQFKHPTTQWCITFCERDTYIRLTDVRNDPMLELFKSNEQTSFQEVKNAYSTNGLRTEYTMLQNHLTKLYLVASIDVAIKLFSV